MKAGKDLREGGRWTPAQKAKNDILFVAVCGVLVFARFAPPRALRAFGTVLGWISWHLFPSSRRIALANLALAFPERTDRYALAMRCYLALGARLGDAIASLDAPLRPLSWADGALAIVEEALAEGRGVMFASAHLGPWEQVAATMIAAGLPMTVVAREAYDPRLTTIYERLRGGKGVKAIRRGSPTAARGLLKVLRRAEILGIPMDLASRVPSIDVPFLDVPASTPVGPAKLALRTQAAVLVGSVAPGPAGLVLSMTRLRIGASDDERSVTIRINAELSARIRALPELWPWMHPRFPTP